MAFIGGLDICFGRWDTHQHRLADYPAEGHDKEIFPGQDYSNPRVKDFANGKSKSRIYCMIVEATANPFIISSSI